jgi:predicted lipase
MNASTYIFITAAINLIGLISFYFVHMKYRKRQELKFTAVVKRITSVRTKDEFTQIFRRLCNNEIRTLSNKQKNEILSLADLLSDNLI